MPKVPKAPGAVLMSFVGEYQLNLLKLAKEIKLSPSAVRQIAVGKTKISVPAALRLAKYFGTPPSFWLNLQQEFDVVEASSDPELSKILGEISKAKKPAPVSKQAKGKNAAAKKETVSDKRKRAAKAPGAKPAARSPRKKMEE